MSPILEKVTAFVIRPTPNGPDLLLFQHPHAGIQIPAGTMEVDETPEQAALREAMEETGLSDLQLQTALGSMADSPPAGYLLTVVDTPIHTRPAATSWLWTHIRRGILVQLNRKQDGFSQVTYQEWDRHRDPDYVTFNLTGWAPDGALTANRRRHFFHFEFHGQTPDTWTAHTDHHDFRLFWAPLTALPVIVEPQQGWLRFLAQAFPQIQLASGEAYT